MLGKANFGMLVKILEDRGQLVFCCFDNGQVSQGTLLTDLFQQMIKILFLKIDANQ
jgi:hypothetical protein